MKANAALKIATNGANFLASIVKPNGKMIYKLDRNHGNQLEGYNILRHAGCIWSILDVYKTTKDPYLLCQSKKALDWMIRNRIEDFKDGSKVVVEKGYAKMGGAALAALALIRYHKLEKNSEYEKTAFDLCKYLQMCIDSNGFPQHMKRKIEEDKDTPVSGFWSDFYQGESVLALCAVGKTIIMGELLDSALDLIKAMYQYRKENGHVRDHWMMQGLEYFEDLFMDYAEDIANRTITDPISNRSAPTACRAETLISYLNILQTFSKKKPDIDLDENVSHTYETLNMLLEKQATSQVQEKGIYEGAFLWKYPVDGEKITENEIIRNDYTQHNISAFIRYYRMKKGK